MDWPYKLRNACEMNPATSILVYTISKKPKKYINSMVIKPRSNYICCLIVFANREGEIRLLEEKYRVENQEVFGIVRVVANG